MTDAESIPTGVSMENASYIESNNDSSLPISNSEDANFNVEQNNNEEEHTPQLFSDDSAPQTEGNLDEFSDAQTEKLFDQDLNEDEDFEIPAFLRKQKF